MPTLADIANAVDSTKRRLGLLASDPVTFWRLLNDEARDANRAAVDRAGLLGSVVPQARDAAWQEMTADPAATATNWMGGGLLGKIVYHGSPHKFDKFDASKIGTGEGAQAYGHGIYLAESPEVAASYAQNLAMRSNGKSVADITGDINKIKETMQGPKRMYALQEAERQLEMAKRAQGNTPSKYTVDLPDEWLPKMLDWDKPLSQQPEAVRKLRNYAAADDQSITGGEFYRRLIQELGAGQEEVAASLAADGFPGIKYLDGNSRVTSFGPRDSGTSNFVVFPGMEGLLKILSRE